MKKTAILVISAVFLAAVFFFRYDIQGVYYDFFQNLPETRKIVANLLTKEISKEVVATQPLVASKEFSGALLTKDGVFELTNLQRKEAGIPSLSQNENLGMAAEAKLQDMFKKQYFAHISPSDKGAGDFAKETGYEFISIGENLALGNFENDKALVQGWMDSPGHRANILNNGYSEIGIAVGKGNFEGRQTWLAVQIFGLPLSACPQPQEILIGKIEAFEDRLEEIRISIEELKMEIEDTHPKRGPSYTDKVNNYNSLVEQYNQLVAETENLISSYNSQVQSFNSCARGE